MNTTPDIHCINILCNGPNGNVQLVFNDFLKANAAYEKLRNAIELYRRATAPTTQMSDNATLQLEDSYGQKCYICTASIDTVLLNDTAASLRGGYEIGLLNDVAKAQYQNKAMNHPAMKAAGMMRNLANGLGPANG